jgi:hypothetical protein
MMIHFRNKHKIIYITLAIHNSYKRILYLQINRVDVTSKFGRKSGWISTKFGFCGLKISPAPSLYSRVMELREYMTPLMLFARLV